MVASLKSVYSVRLLADYTTDLLKLDRNHEFIENNFSTLVATDRYLGIGPGWLDLFYSDG